MNNDTKPKVLMIEDNSETQHLYRESFEMAGFQVLSTNGAGGNFVEAVVGFKPDIISMDIMIGEPGWGEGDMDGFDAIELLRQDERVKDIPIIMMTNFFEDSKVEKAKSLGVVDYINLQGHSINRIPTYFKNYLKDPDSYEPAHPSFRTYKLKD